MNPTSPAETPSSALDELTVQEVMHAGLISCPRDLPLVEIAKRMSNERVHCILLEPGEGEATGDWQVVSDLDLISGAADPEMPAQRVAGTPLVSVSAMDTVWRAARLMVQYQTAHLLVVGTDGLPVGVISTFDIAGVIARQDPTLFRNPGGVQTLFPHIAVALDRSAPSRAALDEAVRLSESSARLSLLHVVPAVPSHFMMFGGEIPLAATIHEEAERWLKELSAGTPGSEAVLIDSGHAGDGICRWVEQERPDLLVIAPHNGTVARVLVGSTASFVIQRSVVDVLIVRPGDQAGAEA